MAKVFQNGNTIKIITLILSFLLLINTIFLLPIRNTVKEIEEDVKINTEERVKNTTNYVNLKEDIVEIKGKLDKVLERLPK